MHTFRKWIGGWIDIATGIVTVLTLGFCRPNWSYDWVIYCALRDFENED